MPLRRVPDRDDLTYHLLSFDAEGRERVEDGGLYSPSVLAAAAGSPPVTDIFVLSHGWKGDVPAAIDQYDRWIAVMYDQAQDRAAAHQQRPGWRSLVVGLHWPSLPWGTEQLPVAAPGLLSDDDETTDEFATENGTDVDTLVELYAQRVADSPEARTALRTVLSAEPQEEDVLPPEVEEAYAVLFAESGLSCDGPAAGPGADQETFSPMNIVTEASSLDESGPGVLGAADVGMKALDLLRMPLRQLSFWKMKDRARTFGESGAHDFLRKLQDAAPNARIHLMGHSFGCIAVSGAVAGPPNGAGLPRPADTLFLVQGALSLWAYTEDVPFREGTPGYFHRILENQLVSGPIVTTRSPYDTAVGRFYPLGAAVLQQVVLGEEDELPEFGGVGTFGIQGVPRAATPVMTDDQQDYDFVPGRVHNIEASQIIATGGGPSGAHSDIVHPEVAHALWQAVLTEP